MLYNIDKEKTKGGLNMKAKFPYNYRIMTYIRSLPPNVWIPISSGLSLNTLSESVSESFNCLWNKKLHFRITTWTVSCQDACSSSNLTFISYISSQQPRIKEAFFTQWKLGLNGLSYNLIYRGFFRLHHLHLFLSIKHLLIKLEF